MTSQLTSDVDSLLLDLLEWVAKEPRTYRQTMDAWRTSCPRLPVWEEAVDRGLVVRDRAFGAPAVVALTPAGQSFLTARRKR